MSSVSALNSALSSTTSTTGIDVSTILAAMVGSAAPGIDVTSAVNSALYADRATERVWQSEQTTISSQMTGLQAMQAAASTLQTDMSNLNSLTGPLSARVATSSDPAAVTATAANGTVLGNHQVTVNSLATTSSWYSSTVASATATLPTGSFTLTSAGGTSTTFTPGSGSDTTLANLVSDINGQNLGVTASVITDSTGSRLSLVSSSSGAANGFSVTGATGLSFTQASVGADASLTVDGVPITSASNTVTGALSGVTLNLLSPTASSVPVTLAVGSDTNQTSTAINQLVSDYNSAASLLNQQFTFSAATGTEGNLASDPTVQALQQTMQSIASYTGTSSATGVNSLSDLGITLNSDGSLSANAATLDSVLTNNPSGVQQFMQGSALNGFAATASNALTSFSDPSIGAFTVDINSLSTQNTDLTNQISNFENTYIAQQQTSLTTDFTNAESALQNLPTQLAQIQAELGNAPRTNNG